MSVQDMPLTRKQRIWRFLRPSAARCTDARTRPEVFAQLLEEAWAKAGFPQVRAWIDAEGEMRSNLSPGGLPPEGAPW